MVLLQELKRSKQEVEPLACKMKLLQQMKEGELDCAVREARTSSKYVEPLLDVIRPHCVGLAMSVTQGF